MDKIVYVLGALTCATCAGLLLRGYLRSKMKLLFWSTICFIGLTVANILVYIDAIILADAADISVWRQTVTMVSLAVLIYSMVYETV